MVGAPVARGIPIKHCFALGCLPILGLLDPRTDSDTDTAARARSFRVRPSAWICVDPTRSNMAGIAAQRPRGGCSSSVLVCTASGMLARTCFSRA